MKKALLLALLATPAWSASTSEVLVTTTGVQLPAISGRTGLEIYNYGPNPLHCSFGTAISSNAFWIVNAYDTTNPARPAPGYWSAAARDYHKIFCVAVTASQLTGAATIINQLD